VTPASDGFRYADAEGALDLPLPALVGAHQLENAGLAIAVLRLGGRGTGNRDSAPVPCPLSPSHIAQGLRNTQWPARLQKLTGGALSNSLPESWELWLDGGHNDSAGAALAQQAQVWRIQDALPRPLYLVCGMLLSKNPREFLAPLVPHVAGLQAVPIPNEASFTGMALSEAAHAAGIAHAVASVDLKESLRMIAGTSPAPGRILICGSLYLAGQLLKEEGFRV
jgi:dihydrofolate synthase/folylpolyglutamate synthase